MRYHVMWAGRTARECSTATMGYIDKRYWDNFLFVALYVVDWELRRIVHKMDIDINEKEGWPPDTAFEKIGARLYDLEKLLQEVEQAIDQGTVAWNDIQI